MTQIFDEIFLFMNVKGGEGRIKVINQLLFFTKINKSSTMSLLTFLKVRQFLNKKVIRKVTCKDLTGEKKKNKTGQTEKSKGEQRLIKRKGY